MSVGKIAVVVAAVGSLGLSACQTSGGQPNNQVIGAVVGAALGGLAGGALAARAGAGAQIAAVIAGAAVGGLIGNAIGQYLDEESRKEHERAIRAALESDRTQRWAVPSKGTSGVVQPLRSYKSSSGQDCRTLKANVKVNGSDKQDESSYCKQSDNTWSLAG